MLLCFAGLQGFAVIMHVCVFVEALHSLLEELLEDPEISAGDRAILFAASLSCTKDFEML